MSGYVVGEVDAFVRDVNGAGITSEPDAGDTRKQRLHVDSQLDPTILSALVSMNDTMSTVSGQLGTLIELISSLSSE